MKSGAQCKRLDDARIPVIRTSGSTFVGIWMDWNCGIVVVAFRPESERFVMTSYQDYIRER